MAECLEMLHRLLSDGLLQAMLGQGRPVFINKKEKENILWVGEGGFSCFPDEGVGRVDCQRQNESWDLRPFSGLKEAGGVLSSQRGLNRWEMFSS